MKSRIEELARELCFEENTSEECADWYLTTKNNAIKSITTAVNEALELAAKECDEMQPIPDGMVAGLKRYPYSKECAEAIRKLKCS